MKDLAICGVTKENRIYGLDFLKCLAMFMVVFLHSGSQTGLLSVIGNKLSVNNFLYWYGNSLADCSVNIFVIISSYFLLESGFRVDKVLKILTKVAFYG